MDRQLWQHQETARKMAEDKNYFFMFFDAGTGKTATSIRMLADKINKEQRILRTIVFAPPITLENWKNEFRLWSKILPEDVTVLYGSGKKRVKLFKEKSANRHNIFVTNYESLLMKELYNLFMQWNPEALILDELHKLKSPSAKRTKLMMPLADKAKYKFGLTGTPVLNSLLDLFSQFRAVDGGKAFGKNWIAFRAKYFYDKNANLPRQVYFPNWQIRPDAQEKLLGIIEDNGMVAKKQDCLDLPDLVMQKYHVELGAEQKRAYDSMCKHFIADLDSGVAVAQLALTKGLRMNQILSGFVTTDDGKVHRFKQNPRLAALRELLQELTPSHKVLVWAVFKENFAQIAELCEDLGLGYTEIHGDISGKRKFENIEHFRSDDNCRVLIGHPGAGGIGINLVEASYSIFYSRTFSLEQSIQAEARNHRGGSEIHEKITRIDLISKDTIDEDIVERLHLKQSISDEVLVNIVKGQ